MKLSREDVLHIALLCRLGLTEADVPGFQEKLSNILENFQALRKVDTTGIPPTAQPFPLQNVMRADEICPSLLPEEVLANAPRREEDFFRVQAVLEE